MRVVTDKSEAIPFRVKDCKTVAQAGVARGCVIFDLHALLHRILMPTIQLICDQVQGDVFRLVSRMHALIRLNHGQVRRIGEPQNFCETVVNDRFEAKRVPIKNPGSFNIVVIVERVRCDNVGSFIFQHCCRLLISLLTGAGGDKYKHAAEKSAYQSTDSIH